MADSLSQDVEVSLKLREGLDEIWPSIVGDAEKSSVEKMSESRGLNFLVDGLERLRVLLQKNI